MIPERTLSFFLPITPRGKMAKAVGTNKATGKAFAYTPASGRKDEENLMALLAQHVPDEPFRGGLMVDIVAFFRVPVSWSPWKYESALHGGIEYTKKPDCDNISKLICDAMQSMGFYHNDSQINYLTVAKEYADKPSYKISIYQKQQPETKKEWEAMKDD